MGRENRTDKASCFASLAEFDVIQTLLSELEAAYQMEDNVMFHYSPEAHNIGVRLLRTSENNDIADLKILMEDIIIIGKGLITAVKPLQSNDNILMVE